MFRTLAFCRLFSSALPRMKHYLSACIPRGGIKDKIQGRFGELFEERAHQEEDVCVKNMVNRLQLLLYCDDIGVAQ